MSYWAIPNASTARELREPQRKPVGIVKVDLDHPLGKDLIFHHIYQANFSPKRALVGGGLTQTGTINQAKDYIYAPGSGTNYLKSSSFDFAGDKTILAALDPQLSNPDFHITIGNPTNYISIISGFQTGRWNFYSGNYPTGSPSGSELNIEAGINYLAFIIRGSNFEVYLNGVSRISSTISAGNFLSTNSGTVIIDGNNAGDGGNNAFHYGLSLYNRALSGGEIKSLHQNPYQFLIPA